MAEEADKSSNNKYPFRFASASHVGQVREENEDAHYTNPDLGLFIVSDGIGGYHGGSEASKIVTEALPEIIKERLSKLRSNSTRSIRTVLKKSIPELNDHFKTEGVDETGFKNMGATVVAVLLKNKRAFVVNLGDSRAYIFRKNRLRQITTDHTVVSELLEKGRIEPEETEDHPAQGQITQYVGIDEKTKPHIKTFAVKAKDRILLCSDGLTDVLDNKALRKILKKIKEPEAACKELVKTANKTSGHDNITTIIIDV